MASNAVAIGESVARLTEAATLAHLAGRRHRPFGPSPLAAPTPRPPDSRNPDRGRSFRSVRRRRSGEARGSAAYGSTPNARQMASSFSTTSGWISAGSINAAISWYLVYERSGKPAAANSGGSNRVRAFKSRSHG